MMYKPTHALVVDDDFISSFMLKLVLQEMDISYEIVTVENGQAALDYLAEQYDGQKDYPNLVFVDLDMPVMDGFEFLEKCRELGYLREKDTRIIILTSSAAQQDVERAKDMGINHYIVKPATIEAILLAIQS